MTSPALHETLRRIFQVLLEEAQHNPDLARRLLRAVAEGPAVQPRPRARRPGRTSAASAIHAINILRQHGEAALRGRLEQVRTAAELRATAAASGLVLSPAAARARCTRAELIDEIVAAARHYDAQRSAASA